MDKDLELLLELQKRDNEIVRFDDLLKALPLEIRQHSASLDAAKNEHDKFLKTVEEKNRLRLAKEREVEEKITGMAKAKTKLPNVKTNAEYKAVLTEIENMKNAVTHLEDEQLTLMEELEESREGEQHLKKKIEEEEINFARLKTGNEAEIKKIEKEKEECQKQRSDLAVRVDPGHLGHYEKLFTARSHKAVVELVGSEKENFCSACHQKVMPRLAVEIRSRINLHKCQHCVRFLYFPEPEISNNNRRVGGQAAAGVSNIPEESPDTTEQGTP
ncbi:MAG: hypothetical protein IEMM0002_1281 [bacterium]|nr:MAG: hypothetical protein IEMM0002_1281 [bacterium]